MAWWTSKTAKELESVKAELVEIKNQIGPTDSEAFRDFFINGFTPVPAATQDAAMRCSAVFACVRLISGAVSSSQMRIAKGERWDVVERHPLKNILGFSPNNNITASTFWKVMAVNKVLEGNAYAPIIRSISGRPLGLIPIKPSRVVPYQAWELGLDDKLNVHPERLFYYVIWDNGTSSTIDQDDMLHFPNICWDGKQGLSTISAGAQAMNLAINAEESASQMFKGGMVNDIALTYPNKMSPDAQELLREHIAQRHSGSANHHKPLILTQGGDVKTLNMNAGDAQLIESRQFSVVDICRFFGVPPVMIGETDKTTSFGSGVEQMARWFVTFTLNDHFTDIEQELKRKLFKNSDYFAYFNESELTRGDTKAQSEYFKAALGNTQQPGWLTPNQVRRQIGEPPDGKKESDELFMPDKAAQSGTPKEEPNVQE